MADYDPGAVIVPRASEAEGLGVPLVPDAPPTPTVLQSVGQAAVYQGPPVATATPLPPTPTPPQTTLPTPTESYPGAVSQAQSLDESISWQAPEFNANNRTPMWYVLVIVGATLLSVLIYFLNKDVVTAVLVLIALVGLAFATARKPKEQPYVVDLDGISVGQKMYYFRDFHSFSLNEEAFASSIILVSVNRFMPAVNIFLPKEVEEQVVQLLASILPMERHKPDLIEKLMSNLHL